MWGQLEGLESEQIELFEGLVEAARNVDRSSRLPFMLFRTSGPTLVRGNGVSGEVTDGDIETLVNRGLLTIHNHIQSGFNFLVSPEGFAAYDALKTNVASQTENIEIAVDRYLNANSFRQRHSASFAKWSEASELVWKFDADQDLTTVGHKCREAMQMFATELVNEVDPPDADVNVQKTINRIAAAIETRKPAIGKTRAKHLDALVAYWRAVNDLAQRQEHAGQSEGEELELEDARRLVFQTAIAMFEIDRSI